ncbi:hypothetical protein ACMFFK_04310 [Serratia marcescens]|uniref:hypothetical protein n=1 Tax=Serratia TaxID=613 RepID=UPI0015D88D0A|nr:MULTISPECIES: hypothetical protein [Serratia]MBJ2089989.1 hypothetical protein [Serratia ureilytica]MBN3987619.1 hypothetical protein [Serratia marcescens]MCX2173123.1 hypothetical protein [Serratia marcescens]MCX2177256.1 hypothetical protein [Serratia marcescens]QLJ58501.1 hypothetical protein HP475_00410 [Serratia marcescens]
MDNMTPTITDQARNSLITANGIIIGFTLAFSSNWALRGTQWSMGDILVACIFGLGVLALIMCLYRALMPYVQTVSRYENNVRLLILGVTFIFIGVILVTK